VGLKLNGTHQFLAYADNVNLLGDNIGIIKKNMNRKRSPWPLFHKRSSPTEWPTLVSEVIANFCC
jgi:hypothetical protein